MGMRGSGVFSGEMGTVIVLWPIAAPTNYSKISGFHTHTNCFFYGPRDEKSKWALLG